MALMAMPAAGQQVVETSTGKTFGGETCVVSEAMLTEIRNGDAADKALASPKTRNATSSPVTFPGAAPKS